jgi:23S rRNA (cytidine2498-2'-O)-methyltransferase
MTNAILTCSEHFPDLALNELRRYHNHLKCITRLSPQHLLISTTGTYGNLVRPWKKKLPIYLHHLFPVHQTVSLNGSPADFVKLHETAQGLSCEDFIVQPRTLGSYAYSPAAITQNLRPAQLMHRDATPSGRVLSILVNEDTAYMGISWSSQNISAFSGGKQFFREPVRNRAGLKLLEAIDAFNVRLYPGTHALDLGAAPGAWTEILRRRGLRVTAVAPNEMYDWLAVDPEVFVFRVTAEEFLAQCDTVFDLLLNDMKMDAQDSVWLMVAYAPYLRRGGIAIMTLKLRMKQTQQVINHALRILREAYEVIYVRQLVSNRKEVTVFLRRHK